MTRPGPYAEYRESGLRWLATVPDHWGVIPFKRVASLNPAPDRKRLDDEASFIPMSAVREGRVALETTGIGRDLVAGYVACAEGDVLLAKVTPCLENKNIAVARGLTNGIGFATTEVYAIRPSNRVDADFLAYLLTSNGLLGYHVGMMRGAGGLKRLPSDELTSGSVPLPPLDEQHAIANYLDRETAQIDALIGKQERLIETLRERRAAVVSHEFESVAPERVQLRRVISFLTSGSRGWGDYYADKGERFLRIGNLPRTNLRLRGDVQYVDLPDSVTEGERTRLREGDLLFSITAYLGSVAVVDQEWVGAYVSQHVALCRLNPGEVDSSFVGWFMLSAEGQDQLKQGAAGGTKQQLSLPDLRELRVPLPPLDEQRRIAAYLDEQTAKIDALIAKAERFIEVSKERRSALITAAVTGQIDVRDAAARDVAVAGAQVSA